MKESISANPLSSEEDLQKEELSDLGQSIPWQNKQPSTMLDHSQNLNK